LPHWLRLVLPKMMAPASRSRVTSAARGSVARRATWSGQTGQAHRLDVVLDQYRYAVQRSANDSLGSLFVPLAGHLARATRDGGN